MVCESHLWPQILFIALLVCFGAFEDMEGWGFVWTVGTKEKKSASTSKVEFSFGLQIFGTSVLEL